VKVVDFGAFVNFLGVPRTAWSISPNWRNERVAKVHRRRQGGRSAVKVKVLGFDDRGKVKLSMRMVVDQATGADISEQVGTRRPREEGEGAGCWRTRPARRPSAAPRWRAQLPTRVATRADSARTPRPAAGVKSFYIDGSRARHHRLAPRNP
jgi:polyribonucleotide nucleotidyltransferase